MPLQIYYLIKENKNIGCYINPTDDTKETWLYANGDLIEGSPPSVYKNGTKFAVCLVYNVGFTAAGVMYSLEEFASWSSYGSDDHRTKLWFWVEELDLYKVSDLKQWLK